MQFGHQVTNSALPKQNRIYCTDARKPKFQFATKEAAEAFIAYCADTIMAQNGFAPVKSYWCEACKCYHVSSQQKMKRKPRIFKNVHENEESAKVSARSAHRTLNRLEKLMKKAFKALACHRTQDAKLICEDCLSLYEKCLKQTGAAMRRERLWEKLNLCVSRISEEERLMMHDLLKIEYHPHTIIANQWYMTRSAV